MSTSRFPVSALESAHRLVQGLIQNGLKGAVVSPGSRNAPLMQALDAAGLPCHVALDERSAAHHALGMIVALNAPVAVCCTSGTAALNHAPALAEAHKMGLPLVSLTADRPPGAQNQWESQTLQQRGIHSTHVRGEFQWLPSENDFGDAMLSAVSKALNCGPVHINCPFSEPLYPDANVTRPDSPDTNQDHKAKQPTAPSAAQEEAELQFAARISTAIESGRRVMLLGGTQPLPLSRKTLEVWATFAVIVGDSTSGLGRADKTIVSTDRWMRGWTATEQDWSLAHPDMVVTFGAPLLSKSLRQALRTLAVDHLHIDNSGEAPSAFGPTVTCIPSTVPRALDAVATRLIASPILPSSSAGAWQHLWLDQANRLRQAHTTALANAPWSDLRAHAALHRALPEDWQLHLGNSTPVRYAQLFHRPEIQPWSNRGVAGIDGCSSTAVGATLAGQHVTLITGDLGFLYDANAFLVHPLPDRLRIAVIHNGGGGVFRWLDGPQRTGMLDSHFEMRHATPLRALCDLHGLEHARVTSETALTSALEGWWDNADAPKVLEISTPSVESAEVYKAYMAAVSA